MKKDVHPKYQKVIFLDSSTGHKFVCGSALQSDETDTFEGVEYPLCRISISSSSHPFFTGSKKHADTEGRVDKFKKRYERAPVAASTDKEGQDGSPSKEQSKEPKLKAAEKPKAAAAKAAAPKAEKPKAAAAKEAAPKEAAEPKAEKPKKEAKAKKA